MVRASEREVGRRGEVKKPKLKKETIRDLDVKGKAKEVRGRGALALNTELTTALFCTKLCVRSPK